MSAGEQSADLRRLRGIVPSLNTPFGADLSLDLKSLRREVEHVVGAGCRGILAMAVAGEGPSLTNAEFAAATGEIVVVNARRVPVIVSVSAPDFDMSRARAVAAKEHGADALLYQPPSGTGIAELKARLSALAEIGPGPIMLQDLDWHGSGLPVDAIVELFHTVPAFQSLKIETVPAGPKYTQVLSATGGSLHVCGGWAVSQMVDALTRGVHAFMPTEFEVVYVTIYDLFAAGEREAALALFEAMLPFIAFSNQHIDVSIRFFKYLRQAAGIFETANCRSPVPELDSYHTDEARRLAAVRSTLDDMAARLRTHHLGAARGAV